MPVLDLEGVVQAHKSEEGKAPCVCCPGGVHYNRVFVTLPPKPRKNSGMNNTAIGQFLEEWLYENRVAFEGKPIKIHFEIEE